MLIPRIYVPRSLSHGRRHLSDSLTRTIPHSATYYILAKRYDKRCSSTTSSVQDQGEPGRPPFPFLWPSLPLPPDSSPVVLPPTITANPKSLWDRLYIQVMSIPVRFPAINRAINVGWISMLLTRTTFPEKFMNGSLLAFEEFLRRLRVGEDTTELLTPDFSRFLYSHLGSTSRPSNLEDGASISLAKDGSITIRDAWVFIGPPEVFALSTGKFGGLLKSKDTHDPRSKTLFLQLPFTSIVQTEGQDTPLALQAESGLRIAVDVEIRGQFKYAFRGDEMTQSRTAVVRFMSQSFEGKKCRDTEEKNKRIFSIRDSIQWQLADIDYTWSKDNFHTT